MKKQNILPKVFYEFLNVDSNGVAIGVLAILLTYPIAAILNIGWELAILGEFTVGEVVIVALITVMLLVATMAFALATRLSLPFYIIVLLILGIAIGGDAEFMFAPLLLLIGWLTGIGAVWAVKQGVHEKPKKKLEKKRVVKK